MTNRHVTGQTAVVAGAAAVGAITGLALKPVLGEAWASTAGSALGGFLDDVGTRMLSAAEQRRILTAVSAGAERIRERWVAGHRLRADVQAGREPGDDPYFREIAEGMITAARNEHEERKLEFLGRLVANLAFTDNIDRGSANWALRTASELSWTQYVLLAVVDGGGLPERSIDEPYRSWESWSAHRELGNLRERRLIGAPTAYTADQQLPYESRVAAQMGLGWGGSMLAQLLELGRVSESDRHDVLRRMDSEEQTVVPLVD